MFRLSNRCTNTKYKVRKYTYPIVQPVQKYRVQSYIVPPVHGPLLASFPSLPLLLLLFGLQRNVNNSSKQIAKKMSTTFSNKLQRNVNNIMKQIAKKIQQNYQTNCNKNVTILTNFYAMSTTQSNLNANVNNINNFL